MGRLKPRRKTEAERLRIWAATVRRHFERMGREPPEWAREVDNG